MRGSIPVSEEEARRLKEEYGVCRGAYMLRVTYGLTANQIAKLFGTIPSSISSCLAKRFKNNKPLYPLEEAPTMEDFKKVCRRRSKSIECRFLKTELFMYAVAREALPILAFWDTFILARSIHRLVFRDIYDYLLGVSILRWMGEDLTRVVKVRGEDSWRVGYGVIAYVFTLLDLALVHKGFLGGEWDTKLREAIKKLTGVDVMEDRVLELLIPISHLVSMTYKKRAPEIEKAREKAYYRLK